MENEISKKIIKMMKADQSVRQSADVDIKDIQRVDLENRKLMKEIVESNGLICKSKFGKEASFAAWLIIQHFPPEETEFMLNYLSLMRSALEDVDPRNVAYLEDRVNMYKNRPQKYGTQLKMSENADTMEFYDIFDVSNVDEFRAEMGLDNLDEYATRHESGTGHKVLLPVGYVA